MRLAVPDLISNSYFPAISAVELGDFAEQGLDVKHEPIFLADKSYQALRDGEVDFIGGSAQRSVLRISRMGGGEAAVRARSGHVLVSGHAGR